MYASLQFDGIMWTLCWTPFCGKKMISSDAKQVNNWKSSFLHQTWASTNTHTVYNGQRQIRGFKFDTALRGNFCLLMVSHPVKSRRSRGKRQPLCALPLSGHSSNLHFQRPTRGPGHQHPVVSHPTHIAMHDCSCFAWTWQQQSHQ